MVWSAQARSIILESSTTAFNEIIKSQTKLLKSRLIVPHVAKGMPWASFVKYWASKGNTEIEFKAKTDTTSNNINLQLQTMTDEIPRFPIELNIPLIVYKEYENNKQELINYMKAHIEQGMKEYQIFVNDFCISGKEKYTGLINDPDLYIHNFDITEESDGTDIFTGVNMFLQDMVDKSHGTFEPQQLVVSSNFYTKLVSNTIGANGDTVLDHLLKKSPYLRDSAKPEKDRIIQLHELNGAGIGGKDRLIALADDDNARNYHFEETMQMVVYAEDFDKDVYYKKWENRSGGLFIDQLYSLIYGDIAQS